MYATIGNLVCRSAEDKDFQQIYDLLVDLVCTDRSTSVQTMQKSNLQKLIEFYTKNLDCLVVIEDGTVVAAYLGKGNSVLHFASSGDIRAFMLLGYVVFCELHTGTSVFRLIGEFSKSSYLDRYATNVRSDGTYLLGDEAKKALTHGFYSLGGVVNE